jgi:ribonuclease HII
VKVRHLVGIDENGFGPRLGPLTATAVTISTRAYDAEALAEIGRAHGIDDSKATTKFGAMCHAESFAMALAARVLGRPPGDADEFFDAVTSEGSGGLRAPCPSRRVARQCFGEHLDLPAFGGDPAVGEVALAQVEREGRLRIERVMTEVVCPSMLNREVDAGVNKMRVDLGLFERLLLDAREASCREVEAFCGMIGGIRDVPTYARYLAREDFEPLVLEKGLRAYRVRGLGVVRFETSADKTHMPVALASMVGKYARELSNHRLLRFYRVRDPSLPLASGYHDPVTTRFIDGATPIREAEGIPVECFLRST